MAGVLAGSHPSPSPVVLPCAPSLAVTAWLFPSKVSAQGRGALPVLVSQMSPMPQLWLAIPGCPGSRTGSPLISLGGKRASGSEPRKVEQRHWRVGVPGLAVVHIGIPGLCTWPWVTRTWQLLVAPETPIGL